MRCESLQKICIMPAELFTSCPLSLGLEYLETFAVFMPEATILICVNWCLYIQKTRQPEKYSQAVLLWIRGEKKIKVSKILVHYFCCFFYLPLFFFLNMFLHYRSNNQSVLTCLKIGVQLSTEINRTLVKTSAQLELLFKCYVKKGLQKKTTSFFALKKDIQIFKVLFSQMVW